MRFKALFVLLLLCGLWPVRAAADNRIILRTNLSLGQLKQACTLVPLPLLPQLCTVVGPLGDPQEELYLITSPFSLSTLLNLVGNPLGIIDAELDQLISLVGGLNVVGTPPAALTDSAQIDYYGAQVWNGYANQPAAAIVGVQTAHNQLGLSGAGIVADIDTGVDPNHPALAGVLAGQGTNLPSYDFTRNQAGASELNDVSADFPTAPPPCPSCQPAIVNQSSAAILDQSSAAILDGNPKYAAFGHGTMVLGVVHLVAPTAQLLPLKAFSSDGTGNLSDVLRAIYYANQNGANVINMSFDLTTASTELSKAVDYSNQQGVVCAASAGNDGREEMVYPAGLRSDVMGVASTNDADQRSYFSNYGNSIVWVAAPGEAIVTTYPFSTYAAGWGTSFSAPFVSGAASLLRDQSSVNESQASAAVAHAVYIGQELGNGRLDLVQALSGQAETGDFSVSASPSGQTIRRGTSSRFTVSVAAVGGFTGTVRLSVAGLPAHTSANLSPSSITGSGSSVLTVRVGEHAPRGTYTLTVTGQSGSLSHSDTLALTIR
jgi:subtilase family protein